jgi:hypothetical protein
MEMRWLVLLGLFLSAGAASLGCDDDEAVDCPVECSDDGFGLSCESGLIWGEAHCNNFPQQGVSECSGDLTYVDTNNTYHCEWTSRPGGVDASCDGHGSCAYP